MRVLSLVLALALVASPSFAKANVHQASNASPFERCTFPFSPSSSSLSLTSISPPDVAAHLRADHARVEPLLTPEFINSHASHPVQLSHLSSPIKERSKPVPFGKTDLPKRAPVSRRAVVQQRQELAQIAAAELAATAAIQVQKAAGEEDSAWTWMDGDEEDVVVDESAARRDELPSVARMEFRMRGRKNSLRMV